jgi:excisionase family DNA binding protein
MDIVTISVKQLEELLDSKIQVILDAVAPNKSKPSEDQWFDLNGLIQYLPSHPKAQTVYDWVHHRLIPFHKPEGTKTLKFLKSEIDEWLKTGRRKTQAEKDDIVKNYLSKKQK